MGSIFIKSPREPIWRKSLLPSLLTKYFEVKLERLRDFLQIVAFSSTKKINMKIMETGVESDLIKVE